VQAAFLASIRDNSGNGWVSPYLPLAGGTVSALTVPSLNDGAFSGIRNKITNASMLIDQRNSGAAQTITAAAALAYTVDRFYAYCTGANVTGQRVAGTAPNAYLYRFTGATSVTKIGFAQRIKADDCQDLAGKAATLAADIANGLLTSVTWSAWYASTANAFGTLASPTRTLISTGTFTVSATLARYSATISIPSAATTGLEIEFSVGAQTGSTWSIGNVQLENGSVATPIEPRPIALETTLCGVVSETSQFGSVPGVVGSVTGTTGTFSGNVQMASLNGGAIALRNKIINGNMQTAQRGTVPFTVSLPVAGTVQYTADRFEISQNTAATSAVAIGGIVSDNALGGSSSTHIYLQTTTAKATLAANDYALIQQNIEGVNVADLKYGTASAKTITISFKASISSGGSTAVISVLLRNSAVNRSYVIPVTITNAAATYSVTIPGDTSGTWLINNGVGLRVGFCCGAGSTYTTSTTGAWQAGSFLAATGTTNLLATATAAFNITDVQLEVGPVATPFEFRPIEIELALCQRYYQQSPSAGAADRILFSGDVTNANPYSAFTRFPVQMRTAPTTIVLTNNSASGFAATSGTASGAVLGLLETRTSTSTTTGAFFTSTYTASAEL
jgi:hypothetical protein